MHVRITKSGRPPKVRRYLQVVRSFRRPDGMPAHEIIMSMPYESELQEQNLRNWVHAQRVGGELVLRGEPARAVWPAQPVVANRAYLDLAVLRRIWQGSGLSNVVRAALPKGGEEVEDGAVLEALILHRCVAPGSKLAAVRWFGDTALPEMMGIHPSQFNNSRLHRALDALHRADLPLQDALPKHIEQTEGLFLTLFMDGTDTWFEGDGPDMASIGKTKDGTMRQKVLIVLVCDHRGFPLRWRTLPGERSELHAMNELWSELSRASWVGDAPIIADRAMGNASTIERIAALGRRFVIAVPESEMRTWAPDLKGHVVDVDHYVVLEDLARRGFAKIDDRTWFLDKGIVDPCAGDAETESTADSPIPAVIANAARVGLEMRGAKESLAALGRRWGCSKAQVRRYLLLASLPGHLLDRVLAGEADGATLRGLCEIADISDGEQQNRSFEALLQAAVVLRKGRRRGAPLGRGVRQRKASTPARVVVYFNPEMFVTQRERAAKQIGDLETWIGELNAKVARTPKRYSKRSVEGQVGRELARQRLLQVYDVEIVPDGAAFRVNLIRDEAEWARRRELDGFSLLVAHVAITDTAAEIVQQYRHRNAVEADFRTIKSVIDLRPVYHFTDSKVQAHVSVCVIALLLTRLLEARLKAAGVETSAQAALEILATCHLNELKMDTSGRVTFTTTAPNPGQDRLLTALRMNQLVDDQLVMDSISPR
jgi:transposase